MFVLNLCRNQNTKMYQMLEEAMKHEQDPVQESLTAIRNKCEHLRDSSSRVATYLKINPCLEVHPTYTRNLESNIPENKRIELSRFRLSAHRLKVETGRWA